VYVDLQGRKSRDVEIMYPATLTGIATTPDGFLMVYSDTHIDVFDAAAGEWCQTINIRKTRPLLKTGALNLSLLQEMPHITYLSNIHKEDSLAVVKPSMVFMGRDGRPVHRSRRRFSIREANKQIKSTTDRRSKMISAPSNFNHITHMGPGDGIQIQRLMDLPTTLETAEQGQTQAVAAQPVHRVKSMFQQSTGKLTPPRLPAHPPPPQRSISHSETGMRSYFNGSSSVSGTPPPSSGGLPSRPPHTRPGLLSSGARASSSSLPRSPDTLDSSSHPLTSGLGTGSGSHLGSNSGQSGQGSLGSHSSHDVNYINIYQNTNHPHLYDHNLEGSPRHSLGSNNSSNLSTPPSPVREMGSSSYES